MKTVNRLITNPWELLSPRDRDAWIGINIIKLPDLRFLENETYPERSDWWYCCDNPDDDDDVGSDAHIPFYTTNIHSAIKVASCLEISGWHWNVGYGRDFQISATFFPKAVGGPFKPGNKDSVISGIGTGDTYQEKCAEAICHAAHRVFKLISK